MTGSLLETKLYVPRRPSGLVARPRLTSSLDRGAATRVTLVSAPPGFGKTTVLADWVAAAPPNERATAWLSLDPADNERTTFWTYVIAALQTVAPDVGSKARSLLREQPSPPSATVLTTLINELIEVPNDIRLVLDDYHAIDAPDIHDGMAFFLEHVPDHAHVVIATRADPPLPLAGLRARGHLVEIRATDLRFTPDEAAAYLIEEMGLPLSPAEVAALEQRTEGWAAALQLAALSLEGRDDLAAFITGFAGDDRHIVDYLVSEVLHRQPDEVRSFLLDTSVLSRLTGALCDAVTDREGGKAMLESLDRNNLFVVALDDHRSWYRYHRLFADVVQARLLDEHPHRVDDLHRRASDWYEHHGERSEAIRHAMAGHDFDRAADLVELAVPALRRSRQEMTLRRWLEALPDDAFQSRPVLCVAFVGALMVGGELEGVEQRLRHAERLLDVAAGTTEDPGVASTPIRVADQEQLRRLPATMALYRAAQARMLGDDAGTVAHARRSFDLAGDHDHLARGGAAALLGLAHWTKGDLDAAYLHWAAAMTDLEKAGHLSDAIGCAISLADIRITQGRLTDAFRTYERGLALATDPSGHLRRGAADMHVGMAELLRERNDLMAAREHLLEAQALGEENGLPQNRHRALVAEARIREAEGDADGAIDLLDAAERVYFGDFSPNVRPVPALKAKVLVTAGRLSEAVEWGRAAGLSITDELSYLREFEHVTFARVLVAQQRLRKAIHSAGDVLAFVARLLEAAEVSGRTGSVIEILTVQALAHEASGDPVAGVTSLERAAALCEPERHVRIVADDGPLIEPLLRRATQGAQASDHLRRLLSAVGAAGKAPRVGQRLVDPLTERELEVLRLLSSDLTGPEIARELFVSLNTMRTHTKSIYTKLGVNGRRTAVRRAGELGLLS